MKRTVYVSDLNCESCELVVKKIASRNGVAASQADYAAKTASLEGDDAALAKTLEDLNAAGYAASFEGLARQTPPLRKFAEFAAGALLARKGFQAETGAAAAAGYSFIVLALATIGLHYFGVFRLGGTSWYYAFLGIFATAVLAGVSWQVVAYRRHFTHMNGMMVGMGVGMGAGFLAGALIGATNGMFLGSLVGMAAGMLLGAYLGYCCGVMGVLEGLMGGLMAGTMGAMLSVMMVFDHLDAFLGILFATMAAILAGLSYMVYKENRGMEAGRPATAVSVALALLSHLVILFLMVYGPRGASAYVVG